MNNIGSKLKYKKRIPYSFWTYKRCKESSLKYMSKSQWKKIDIKRQIDRYTEDAKFKYHDNFTVFHLKTLCL